MKRFAKLATALAVALAAASFAPGCGDDSEPSKPPGESDEGDERPIRSEVVFKARGGRIRPALARVPPFILVFVRLESADGRTYVLRIGDKTVRAGSGRRSAGVELPGLRPGEAYIGRPAGAGTPVRIEASNEPE